jgi:putative transposase
LLCRLLEVPRSSLLYRRRPERDLDRLESVIQHNRVTFRTAGYSWMFALLKRQQVLCTREEVRKVYIKLGILGKRAPPRVRTTDSNHEHPRYPNIVRELKVTKPDQVWVADTTEFRIGGRRTFLALVEDVYTRRVMGFALSFTNNSFLTLEALEMALRHGCPEIHHSDQGSTYASETYAGRLRQLGVILSMARAGCAWENGHAERLNRTFKDEEILRSEYETLNEARTAIREFVKLYNEQRIHMSLRYRTPNEVKDAYAQDQTTGE